MIGLVGISSPLLCSGVGISVGGNLTVGCTVDAVYDRTLDGVGLEAGGLGFGHLFFGFLSLSLSGVLSS